VAGAGALGLPVVRLGRDVTDLDGTLERWLHRRRATVAIVRPDRHVFAAGGPGLLPRAGRALGEASR
jgi:hypothetical protein